MTRQVFGMPDGIPEGSDFTLEAKLTVNGVPYTSTGTFTVTFSDSVLNAGVALLTDEASDSYSSATSIVKWNITDTQSSGWEAGTYNGDIKCVDSALAITYWPVSIKVREAKD